MIRRDGAMDGGAPARDTRRVSGARAGRPGWYHVRGVLSLARTSASLTVESAPAAHRRAARADARSTARLIPPQAPPPATRGSSLPAVGRLLASRADGSA